MIIEDIKKSKAIVLVIIFGMVFTAAMAAEVQNKGAEEIRLDSGKKDILISFTGIIRTL